MNPTSAPSGALTPAQISQARASLISPTTSTSSQNDSFGISTPAPTQTVQSNLENTFNQGASNIENDIGNVGKNAQAAGGSPLAYAAAGGAAAGHVAGDIAGTAGGILGSFIAPLLPDSIKQSVGDATNYVAQKVNQIPGMTPDIAKSLGDIFNTGTLALGANAEEPAVNAVKSGAQAVGDTITQGVEGVKNAVSDLGGSKATAAAQVARESAAQAGVKSLQDMTGSVSDYKNDLGTAFKKGATDIETKNPNLKLTLTSDQTSALNQLKDNKSFALPDYLKPTHTPENISDIETTHELSPTQAQDLITQLNRSTFTDKSSGLGVDQSKIGLTNDIKGAASKAFGGDWDKVYGDYARGQNALDKISDIVNLDKNATASDVNKSLNSIKKLQSSPEGKIILKNAVNEFKNTSGVDLNEGTSAISKVLEKEMELEKAQKPGLVKQTLNPVYLGRSAVRYGLITGGLAGLLKILKGK